MVLIRRATLSGMSAENLTVVVLLTQRDIYKGNAAIARGRYSLKRWLVIVILSIAGATCLFFLAMSRSDPHPSWLAALMLGAGVVLAVELLLGSLAFLVIHAFAYYGARTLLRSNPNASGPVTYEFSAGGASYAGPTGHGQIEWTAYLRIRETSEQFLL